MSTATAAPAITTRYTGTRRGNETFDVVVPAGLEVSDSMVLRACDPHAPWGGNVRLVRQPDGSRKGTVEVYRD